MALLGNPLATAFSGVSKQTITGNGGVNYTLDFPAGSNQDIEVYVNNVRQEPGVAYNVAGTALTMTGNVTNSDDFYVVFQGKAQQTIVPSTGSVTDSMITGLSSSKLTGALPALDGAALTNVSGGKLLQVQQQIYKTFTSITSTSLVDTGLTVNITPANASNKVLVRVNLNYSGSLNAYGRATLLRGSTVILIGDEGDGSGQTNASVGLTTDNGVGNYKYQGQTFEFLDSPSTTSQVTYKVQAAVHGGSTINFNRANADDHQSYTVGTTCSMIALEIEA